MDDTQRVALVETETIVGGNAVAAPVPLQRHQLGNHLGSASVELDADGALISYEEYHPYGTTAFQAGAQRPRRVSSDTATSARSATRRAGLSYHGARYYAPWLGRWASADPAGLAGGVNLFAYASANPIRLVRSNGSRVINGTILAEDDPKGDRVTGFEAQATFNAAVGAVTLLSEPTPTTARQKSVTMSTS